MAADPTGRANGRGAYLCNRLGCWENGIAKRALDRHLRTAVSNDDVQALQDYFINQVASGGAVAGSGQNASPGTIGSG